MAIFTAIAAAITSAFFAVAGAMGATLATAGLALAGTIVGYVGAAVIYGGVALALSSVAGKAGKSGRAGSYGDTSATYGNPVLQTQTNQDLPIPLLYGTVKLGGNRIWQDDNVKNNIKRIVGFAEGEITDFTDIRLNDIKQDEIKGIKVNKYYGTDTQEVDAIVGGKTLEERVEKVGSLKNVAYLAIDVPKGDKLDANYNLTTIVKGRKIRVYTTPTNYTVKYSENPAWVMFDFLTSYNGLGLCLNNDGTINDDFIAQLFDMYSFIESAAFCDEKLLSDIAPKTATTSTKFKEILTFNREYQELIFQQRTGSGGRVTGEVSYKIYPDTTIQKVIDDLGNKNGSFVQTVTFKDGKLTLQASSATNMAHCIGGSEDLVNAIGLTIKNYTATTNEIKQIFKENSRFTFNMIFDSQASARDLLDEIYRSCRGNLFTKNGKLQFKIDKAQAVSKVFKANDIIKGSETFGTIPTEEHYDILKLVYISPEHEWQKVEAFAEIPQYRDGVPIEHGVNCYSVTNFQQASRLAWYYVNSKILCPYFGSFKTDYRAYDLEVGDVIQFDSLLMGLTNYRVKVTSVIDDGAGTFTINWRNYDERLYNDTLGSKQPRVLVSNLSDIYSIPGDVIAFNVVQNQKLVEFAWTSVAGTNITYEIRQGETWDNSQVVAKNISNTTYTTNLNSTGIYKYWIKAKNTNNYSENALSDILNVQYIPDLNEIVSTNILENAAGTYNNTKIEDNILKLLPTKEWEKLNEPWKKSGDRYYATSANKWGAICHNYGTYVSQIYDIGANITSQVSFSYESYIAESNQNIKIEWRHSSNGTNWSSWYLASIGSYTFRYYQIKITMENPSGLYMDLSAAIINIDVPDRTETYTNRAVTNASNGLVITYATDAETKLKTNFVKQEPHVLVTPFNTNAYPDVIESKPGYCKIKLYDNAGNVTTGNCNITVTGY